MKRHRVIQTNRKTSQILDGSYNSVYKGRSNNFGELREYADGDDVKDIDWKASARSRKMLVRQYIAEKKHNVMLVMDTNKRMLADTAAGEEKRDVVLMSGGTLACMVEQNGDYVSATYASNRSIHHFPFKTGLGNIENILGDFGKSVTMDNHSVIGFPLDYILHHFKRRMIILIVTDTDGVLGIPDILLKRLLVLHDLLVVRVSDADLSGDNIYDIELGDYLPDYFTKDKKLIQLEEKTKLQKEQAVTVKLKHFGIASVMVDSVDQIETKLVELLSNHKGEKR
ncbi:MAG: DUF58 domain-containing protein [Lachnospiraceae bacterium]